MNKDEIMKKLQIIIREAVNDDEVEINANTVASDIEGWDSLAQIVIMGELQNELNVKFTSSEINGFANIGELVDAIKMKL